MEECVYIIYTHMCTSRKIQPRKNKNSLRHLTGHAQTQKPCNSVSHGDMQNKSPVRYRERLKGTSIIDK